MTTLITEVFSWHAKNGVKIPLLSGYNMTEHYSKMKSNIFQELPLTKE